MRGREGEREREGENEREKPTLSKREMRLEKAETRRK